MLKGLSLSIKPREKIGIVGRTGCGKSTLMSTLFRIVEPTGGRVVIDGHELAQVPLHQLRTKLALVPQVRKKRKEKKRKEKKRKEKKRKEKKRLRFSAIITGGS